MLVDALKGDLWDIAMIRYGILNFTAEQEVFPQALDRRTGVLAMASVRQNLATQVGLEAGLRAAKAVGLLERDAVFDQDPLGFLVHDNVPSVLSAAYKFAAAPKAVSTVLIGTGDIAHLEANVAAILGPPLPGDDDARIRRALDGVAISG